MPSSHLRQATTLLLESAIRIAPEELRDWGRAMLGEIGYVEGSWTSLMWALGCTGVLVRRTLFSLFFPRQHALGLGLGRGFFDRKIPVAKMVLAGAAGCLLGALLFFAAPPFRQGLRVALNPWARFVGFDGDYGQARLEALARRAARNHDAEGMAFCAVRLADSHASARLAGEAVHLDPNLIWVYALVAVRHPGLPEIRAWLTRLERWEPSNALFPLLRAQSQDLRHFDGLDMKASGGYEQDTVWQSAMASAFKSAKFDDYLNRMKGLDRTVVLRYRFYQPAEVLLEPVTGFPLYAAEDSRRYGTLLIRRGQSLEAEGQLNQAAAKYWAVARFGQLVNSGDPTGFERFTGESLQASAYTELQSVAKKQGKGEEAQFFGYLAAKFDPAKGPNFWRGDRVFVQYICERNAAFLQFSGLLVLVFAGLILATVFIFIFPRRARGEAAARRAKARGAVLGLTGAVGLLLSCATLYLTFRPYWYIFQSAVLTGDRSHVTDLANFLEAAGILPGTSPGGGLSPNLEVYFWAVVALSGVAGLLFILLRHFGKDTPDRRTFHSPQVP